MKDADWRGLVLKALYDVRHDPQSGGALLIPDSLNLPGVEMDGQNKAIVANIAEQLKDHRYITWSEHHGAHRQGRARITAFGVDVIEGTKQSEITITIDQSTNIQHSQHVQIGKGNIQDVGDIRKLNMAIDEAMASMQEKEEAKSLLKRVLENPLLKGIIKKFGWDLGGKDSEP
jgi:hypothetical protein